MSDRNNQKMIRQLKLYDYLTSTEIHGPSDIMSETDIGISSIRMLQRDLKDLRDSGLINVKYNKEKNNYVAQENPVFDENAKGRRRQHLIRLNRIGTLMCAFTRTDIAELESYELLCEECEYIKEHPEEFPEEDFYDDDYPEMPVLADIKAEYYELFPYSNERTRQRDFNAIRDAGYILIYIKKFHSYVFETQKEFSDKALLLWNHVME